MNPTTRPSALPRDEVHVWYARPHTLRDPVPLFALLSPEERERHGRFRFPEDRQEYLAAHALLRVTLSQYAPVPPNVWRFRTGTYGRPELAGPAAVPPLRFNLSHTAGLVACAVAQSRDVGIDVERVDRGTRALEVAERTFAPSELRDLLDLPEKLRAERFIRAWTLKEAYVKARGVGLSLPVREAVFSPGLGAAVHATFGPSLHDLPAAWHFEQWMPTAEHVMAVAVRRGSDTGVQIIPRGTPWG
ncbi:MAG TPA: 4'-phosphopantetheinyl transferase superfamily protein [Myxococcaceae bacterium]|nr:4'-phosphopantetheinyl transferase superfamily protein [Myxococcaceae bacterium]